MINDFQSFLKTYDGLALDRQDADTLYLINSHTRRHEIYLHFMSNNIEDEFSYNYTTEDQKKIVCLLGSGEINSFDIQFRNETLLQHLLSDFKEYLMLHHHYQFGNTLVSHPLHGVVIF